MSIKTIKGLSDGFCFNACRYSFDTLEWNSLSLLNSPSLCKTPFLSLLLTSTAISSLVPGFVAINYECFG